MLTFLSLHPSAHRQAATHHSPGPIQSDTRGGQCGAAEVPGIRRPHPLHQLAEGWGQSARKGRPHVPAGAGQPADQEHQGKGCHGFTGVKNEYLIILVFIFVDFIILHSYKSLTVIYISLHMYSTLHLTAFLQSWLNAKLHFNISVFVQLQKSLI